MDFAKPSYSQATVSAVATAPDWVQIQQGGMRTTFMRKTRLGEVWEVTNGGDVKTACETTAGDRWLLTNTLANLASLLA